MNFTCSLICGAAITISKVTTEGVGGTDEQISFVGTGHWHRVGCAKVEYQHAVDRTGVITSTLASNPTYSGGSVFSTLLEKKTLPYLDPNAPAKGLKKKQVIQAVQRLKAKEKPKLDKDITMADVLQHG